MSNDKIILYITTIIIDCFLLYILFYTDNNFYDKLFIYITVFCHILFFYALSIENIYLLDILHIFVFILPLWCVFINNKYIKIVVSGLLILIQTLWKIKGKCILHNFPTNFKDFGCSTSLQIYTGILTVILIGQSFSIDTDI